MSNTWKKKVIFYYNKYRNFILYGIIGALSASLDFGVYTLFCFLNINYLVANIIGIHCGIFTSFLLNRYYNFKVKDKVFLRFLSFYSIGLIGLALSTGMLFLMVDTWNWNAIYSKLITIVVVAIIQFLLNKLITFKKTEKHES